MLIYLFTQLDTDIFCTLILLDCVSNVADRLFLYMNFLSANYRDMFGIIANEWQKETVISSITFYSYHIYYTKTIFEKLIVEKLDMNIPVCKLF